MNPVNQAKWRGALKLPYIRRTRDIANLYFNDMFKVDVLIGLDEAEKILEGYMYKPKGKNGPVLQQSKFGTIVWGKFLSGEDLSQRHCNLLQSNINLEFETSEEELKFSEDQRMENAYTLDSIGIVKKKEDNIMEEIDEFEKKIVYNSELKRYEVPLKWGEDPKKIDPNLGFCINRLKNVVERLEKTGHSNHYMEIMKDAERRGIIEQVPESEGPWRKEKAHYISHFPVMREESATTPIRIVYAANIGKPSLNDLLDKGPNLLHKAVTLINIFRTNKVAFCSDIQKAFPSIGIVKEDRDYLRFVWFRDHNIENEMVVFRFTAVAFGPTCSPFCLNIVIRFHVRKYDSKVAKDLTERIYSDNVLSGTDSVEAAINYYREARMIMGKANFNLREWCSNSEELFKIASEEKLATNSRIVKILGLMWNSIQDILTLKPISLNLEEISNQVTKRKASSLASTPYDPMGYVGPVLIPVKIACSKAMRETKSWNGKVSPEVTQEIKESLVEVKSVFEQTNIPRFMDVDLREPVTLHIFCDASILAAGCVAYLCQGSKIYLVASRAKLPSNRKDAAPLSIPQLELAAVVMGARFGYATYEDFQNVYRDIKVRLWTDSEICLFWMDSTKKNLPSFVMKSRKELDDLRSKLKMEIGHVASKDNPADLLSRGMTADEFIGNQLWFYGPSWLAQEEEFWPKWNKNFEETCSLLASVNQKIKYEDIIDPEGHNDLNSLLRAIALILRYIKKFKARKKGEDCERLSESLTGEEINSAEETLIKLHQVDFYSDEINFLKGQHQTRPGVVHSLGLFLDSRGILRASGRLANSPFYKENSFPILIGPKSHVAKLIIDHAHKEVKHYGLQATIEQIRRRFWIPKLPRQVQNYLTKCVTCRKVTGAPYRLPLSGNLPEWRLDPTNPMNSVGIDYTGHFFIRDGQGVHQKVYILIIICAATRFVNLEIVNDMGSSSFLHALRRHCAAYGKPSRILCDNAPTFHNVDQELNDLLKNLNSTEVSNHFAKNRISFNFIPPRAPWWGGMYERIIGIIKSSLKKTIGRALLSRVEFETFIKEVASIVNCRPLTKADNQSPDGHALTPSELVFGRRIIDLPHQEAEVQMNDPDYSNPSRVKDIMVKRSMFKSKFQKQFDTQYLSSLRERHAQNCGHDPKTIKIKVGDVVMVYDDQTPRRDWKIAIVTQLFRGENDTVRSAEVRYVVNPDSTTSSICRTSLMTRAINHLIPLEMSISSDLTSEESSMDTTKESISKKKASVVNCGKDRTNQRPKRQAAINAMKRFKDG